MISSSWGVRVVARGLISTSKLVLMTSHVKGLLDSVGAIAIPSALPTGVDHGPEPGTRAHPRRPPGAAREGDPGQAGSDPRPHGGAVGRGPHLDGRRPRRRQD